MHKILLVLIIFCATLLTATAQNATSDLIKQGLALHNQGKYAEAIDKFNEALKTDPDNAYANYQIAYSLYAFKKPNEAIPYLQKADKSVNAELSMPAYVLLASIYDESNQPKKAIETYNEAIKINPNYPQIYYNLGIAYFRNQQFAEAENSAVEAVKHDAKNASSQRLYALVTFHQNKRANALLGFCSFILLEPTGQRATEAYANIQHIIQGGELKNANGGKAISPSDKETASLNQNITRIVQASKLKNLKGADLLEYQLKNIFILSGQLSEKKADKTFFDKFYADYFYKLAQTTNMPAFTRVIALTGTKEDVGLAQWLQSTERSF